MPDTIDSLQIEINAKATKANDAIDGLVEKLDRLTTSLSKIDGTNLNGFANGAQRVGTTSNSVVRGLNNSSNAAVRAKKSFSGLASAIGKFYATYFMVIRGLKGLWSSIESTADYIEAYNYFNVSLGKIGSDWSYQFEKYGYENAESYADSFADRLSERIGKLSGLQVSIGADGKGLLTETGMKNLGLNIQEITQYASQLASVTNSVGQTGETSLAIASSFTKLAGDISSLFNVDYSSVSKNLQSGLIGQSRALYKYGIDITNATLQTYAYNLGLSKAVSEMTQAEKMQLRMIAILDQSKVSWGDLANTINSPSNMIRQFNNNVKEVGIVLGQLFVPTLQNVLPLVNGFTIAIKGMLVTIAQLMGIKIDFDAFGKGYENADNELGDISDSLDDVTESAKKANTSLRAFDELKVINTPSAKSDAGESFDITQQIIDAMSDYEKAWNDAFDGMENKAQEWADRISKVLEPLTNEAFFGLSEIFDDISNSLTAWGVKIKWNKISNGLNSIYDFAKKFVKGIGSGFLDFIGGLADIGAPAINLLADGIDALFTGMSKADPEILTALGGALGGLLSYKISSATVNGIVSIFNAIKGMIASANPLAIFTGSLFALSGAIIALGESASNRKEMELFGDTLDNIISEYNSAIKTAQENRINLNETFQVNENDIRLIDTLWQKYQLLAEEENKTAEQQKLLKIYADELVGLIPDLSKYIDAETGAFKGQWQEIDNVIQKQKELYRVRAAEDIVTGLTKSLLTLEVRREKLLEKIETAQADYEKLNAEWFEKFPQALRDSWGKNGIRNLPSDFIAMHREVMNAQDRVEELTNKYDKLNEEIYEHQSDINKYLEIATSSLSKTESNVKDVVFTIDKEFKAVSPMVRKRAEEMTNAIGEHFGGAGGKFINQKVKSLINNDILSVLDAKSEAKNIGKNIVEGLGEGIDDKADGIFNKVKNLAESIASQFKIALDIHSPSGVMDKIGGYTMEGYEIGVERGYKPILLSLKNFGFEAVEAMRASQLNGYSDYFSSIPSYNMGNIDNYYTSNTATDNSEISNLLRELIVAVKQGNVIEIDGSVLGSVIRKEDRNYYRRTGQGMFAH